MARPRVLVVQSYAMDYSWSADVDKAIRRVLKEKSYQVRYHYMDTKSHSDAGFKRIAGARVRKLIDEWQPNALVLVDDNAQSLVGICYVDPAGRDVRELRAVKGGDAQSLFGSCHA